MRRVTRVVWYRLHSTARRRAAGLVGLVLLVGVIGGVAMGSVAAARRTQSSYPRFLASTNPSDLTVSIYGFGPTAQATLYSPATTAKIAHLPLVRHVESWAGVFAIPLKADGTPNPLPDINIAGSVDGLYFTQDRATPVAGRMANPARADEFVTTPLGASLLGIHVGELVPFGVLSPGDFGQPGLMTNALPAAKRRSLRLVGLVTFNTEVVEDETDRLPTNILFTPAFTRQFVATNSTQGTWYGLQLDHGVRDVPTVERELIGIFSKGTIYNFRVTALGEAKVLRAVKPESIALAAFGAIAMLAALALALQAVSRQLWDGAPDRDVLRALGAPPSMLAAEGITALIVSVIVGSFLACGIAIALSPIAPLGPVRRVYPSGGVAIDFTVLGVGVLVLVGVIGGISTALALRRDRRTNPIASGPRASRVAQAISSAGLPATVTVGARFALEPGRGRTAVPVRSALCGTCVAVLMVVATLTFGSGLRTLVASPHLYGWNWSYILDSVNDVPPQTLSALDHDPKVDGWSPYNELNGQINGQNVPILLAPTRDAVSPPLLSGHAVSGDDQAVLGAATLAALHSHVGATIVFSYGTPDEAPLYIPPTRLTVVGTATLPAINASATLADHVSMGIGALVPIGAVPAAMQAAAQGSDPTLSGPSLVMVRLRPGVSSKDGSADMQRAAAIGNSAFAADPNGQGDSVSVVTVERPGEIVNYRSTGAAPVVLAIGLAFGATVALALILVSSVRRRGRDLGVLKALGFTRRQLAATVAWQASIIAVVGAVVGVPAGIAAGRWLWTLFAREIYAVPNPTVPASVAVVAIGTVVLANLVAAVPGQMAARTQAATALRSE